MLSEAETEKAKARAWDKLQELMRLRAARATQGSGMYAAVGHIMRAMLYGEENEVLQERMAAVDAGPVPTKELDPRESTAPMDRDAEHARDLAEKAKPQVEEARRVDHIKTQELPTLARLGLGGAS